MEELTQFYARLLRIERPWIVIEVRFPDQERVDVYVDHERGIKLRCPRCDAWCPVYDHSPEREWRHLDTCDVPTYVHTRLPRVQCKVHGVLSIASEWAEPGSNLTRALEAHVIDLAKEASLQAVSRLTGLSWDRCCGVLDRAVRRGQRRKAWKVPVHLGVDEKAFAKRHQYMTLVCDLETKSVEYVAEGRRQESLEEYFLPFDEDELERIEAICVDMHDPYIAAVRARVPGARDKIVFDKFHVLRLMNEAVDRVRRQEHKKLRAQHDEVLTGTKYLWLYRPDHIPEAQLPRFEELRRMDLQGQPRLGPEGESAATVDLPPPRLGSSFLPTLVFLGHPQSSAACDCGRPHPEAATRQYPDLPATPDHQRPERVRERAGGEGQAHGPRLSQPHPFPDRHLLPLRRTRPLSSTPTCRGYPQ